MTLAPPQARKPPRSTATSGAFAGPVAGAAFAGAAWLAADLTPFAGAVTSLSGAALVAAALAGAGAQRTSGRQEVLATIATTLAPLIGHPVDTQLRARSWTSGWIGLPERLTLIYDPKAPSDEPEWAEKISKALCKRTRREYEVVHHDPLKHSLALKILPPRPVAADAPAPELARRAEDLVAHLLGADAKVQTTWDGHMLAALDVRHHQGVRVSPNPVVRSKIEKSVGTMLPGRWRARWDLEADTVRFELRPQIPDHLDRDLSMPAPEQIRLLPVGVDEDGRVCSWDLRSSAGTPHFMITGSTGAGKTAVLRTLATEICRRGWLLRVCDPKRVEFVGLKGWPNVEIVATSVEAMVATIHRTYLEMERRYQAIESGQAVEGEFEPLFLLLDEYRYFFSKVNAWYAYVKATGGSKTCPIFDEVFQIAMLGRTADVHLLLGTQRPDASWLGGDVRDQFAARASMGRMSPDGAKMMWDSYHVGTTVPRRKPGRGTIIGPDDAPVEFQGFWTPNPTKAGPGDLELLERLKPATVTFERHVVVPLPRVDDDGEPIEEKGRYAEYLLAPYEPAADHPDLQEYVPDPLGAGTWGGDAVDEFDPPAGIDTEEADSELDYAAAKTVRASALEGRVGHLIEVDPDAGVWAVIESAERDATDSDAIAVLWRSDEDGAECGVLVLADDDLVDVRAPLDADSDSDADLA